MRVLIKEQLYEMLDMMHEAMKYERTSAETIRVLTDCQNAAIEMGGVIEQDVSAEHEVIKYLEEYVEDIYQAVRVIEDNEKYNWFISEGERCLFAVRDQIKERIDNTLLILFIPYKASMWDCFDSIYRAIEQEGIHQTLVMPIPYNSFNAKQQVIKMNYEGNKFPSNIRVIDYRTYDLSAARPDVIFIHNPYDEYNYVTRVPERFYSRELIKITKHLVYIPYLVRSNDRISDSYVLVPGVLNAWRVYVQSEEIRKCYLEYYPFGNKVVAMGSPKADMVVRMNEQKKILPDDWKEKLQGRKIFLYNTHLHNVINHSDRLLAEYDYVLQEFAGREDIALLWRPHPLSEETIITFRPQIYGAYREYLSEMVKKDNIVIDYSGDLHRAIAISDAYIGDQSSLVELFGITGKPMFLIKAAKMTDKQLQVRKLHKFTIDHAQIWAVDKGMPGIFKIDMRTGTTEYKARLVMNNLDIIPDGIIKIEHKVLITSGRYLFVYDFESNLNKIIDLGGILEREKVQVMNMCRCREEVWLLPTNYGQSLLVYNYHDDSVRSDKRFEQIRSLCNVRGDDERTYIKYDFRDERIVFLLYKTNIIIDMDSLSGEIVTYKRSQGSVASCAGYKDILWLLNKEYDTLICCDRTTHKEERFYFGGNNNDKLKRPYDKIIPCEDYVYILPLQAEQIVIFERQKSTFSFIGINSEYLSPYYYIEESGLHFCQGIPNKGGIALITSTHTGILRLMNREGEWLVEFQPFQIEQKMVEHWLRDGKSQLYDSEYYLLPAFIARVSQSLIPDASKENNQFIKHLKSFDGRCGERIWQDIIAQLPALI